MRCYKISLDFTTFVGVHCVLSIQENMCGHRGLELDSDLQVYEMSLTQEFRNHYEKIFSPISDDSTPVGVVTRRGKDINDGKT